MDKKRAVINFILWFVISLCVVMVIQILTTKNNNKNRVVNYTKVKEVDFYRKYKSKIDKNNYKLRKLALSLVKDCEPNNKECMIVNIYRYIQSEINYLSDPVNLELIQSPEETLSLNAGDCEDLSILLASLLYNIGINSYLVHVPSHMYVMACGINQNIFYNELYKRYKNYFIHFKEQKFYNNRSIWYVELNNDYFEKSLLVRLNSSKPVDIYAFVSINDLYNFKFNKNYNYYSVCSYKDITNLDTSCSLSAGSILAVHIKHKNTYLDILGEIDPIDISKNLHFYEINNQSCIALDPSIKGNFVLPGMEMDISTHNDKKVISLN